MILHVSTAREADKNTYYPRSIPVNSLADLQRAVLHDHIAGKMKNNHRGINDFLSADCIIVDLDNTHSQDPADWKTIDDIAETFPDVMFYAIQSRNYMKVKTKVEKDGTTVQYEPREKFHLYFPLSHEVDKDGYTKIVMSIIGLFMYLDPGAIDPPHFFYGVADPKGEYVEGSQTIDEFLRSVPREEIAKSIKAHADMMKDLPPDQAKPYKKVFQYFGVDFENGNKSEGTVLNETPNDFVWVEAKEKAESIDWLERWAAAYGVTLGTRYEINTVDHPETTVFCVSCPWEDEHTVTISETDSVIMIGKSGKLHFLCRHAHCQGRGWKEYRAKIEEKVFTNMPAAIRLKPERFTDLEQAAAFMTHYGKKIRFSRKTGFLVYDGHKWNESEEAARLLVHEFIMRQAKEAKKDIRAAQEAQNHFIESLRGRAIETASKEAEKARELQDSVNAAREYQKNTFKYQASGKISAVIQEAAPMANIDIDNLDSDGYALNTPSGVINLRTGEIRPSQPEDYCTKITACGPSDQGAEEWAAFLDQITDNDVELADYLQIVFGMAALGEVKQEKLLIAYGSGGNGKSTLCNAISYVLGDYAGTLSADALTMNSRKNLGPEYAALRGKRLVIASELSEGMRLSTSVVKQLCSTDRITADPKYKDPFFFKPSHTLVLFTNHLPKVGTNDAGTWARLVVIPFKGIFRNTSGEIMNYAANLADRCGGAILQWTIEGAIKFIASGYRLPEPEAVRNAIAAYQDDNDWLSAFLDECCDVGTGYITAAGVLYAEYQSYCDNAGEYRRSKADFKAALINAGFKWHKDKTGQHYSGVRISTEFKPASSSPFMRAM